MKVRGLFLLTITTGSVRTALAAQVWEKQELPFTAAQAFTNAYIQVVVWVDLAGPNFNKRKSLNSNICWHARHCVHENHCGCC